MFFKKKAAAPALPSVRIRSGKKVIYEGLLKDIPIKEKVLIEKSIYFFDDPEPCFIHRDAGPRAPHRGTAPGAPW